ncbi:MAG: V-type ATP synthase subunit D [Christensenellales bacterium]|jgi:V/A-type H+-transporting ATPase subunit D
MAAMRVNPTRMELTRLKKRLVTAQRGHKLLKDKRDEMMRQFIDVIKRNKALREEVEGELTFALKNFVLARAVMPGEMVEQALIYPASSMDIQVSLKNIMSVDVPVIAFEERQSQAYPYGYLNTTGELDDAIASLRAIFPKLVELAQVEKTCNLLADEIEKTRRRVNALEYVMIPQLEETIREISMKLEENERGNLTRLMKVKDMIAQRQA